MEALTYYFATMLILRVLGRGHIIKTVTEIERTALEERLILRYTVGGEGGITQIIVLRGFSISILWWRTGWVAHG